MNIQLQEARVAFDCMHEFTSLEPEQSDESQESKLKGFERLDAQHLSFRFPGEEGANISGGQQQLVALARALYQQPELLLLDEPTAAMDREMEADMLDLLGRLKPEMAVIMASHRTQGVKRADRLYVLKEGRVEEAGPPEALAEKDNLFARALADRVLLQADTPA